MISRSRRDEYTESTNTHFLKRINAKAWNLPQIYLTSKFIIRSNNIPTVNSIAGSIVRPFCIGSWKTPIGHQTGTQ